MNYLQRLAMRRAIQPSARLSSEEKRKIMHQRELYRGLTVPYSNAPGRKRLHPNRRQEAVK